MEKGTAENFGDIAPKGQGFASGAGDASLLSSPLLDAASKRVAKLDVRCDSTTGGPRGTRHLSRRLLAPAGDLLLEARLSTASSVRGAIVGGNGAYADTWDVHVCRPSER